MLLEITNWDPPQECMIVVGDLRQSLKKVTYGGCQLTIVLAASKKMQVLHEFLHLLKGWQTL